MCSHELAEQAMAMTRVDHSATLEVVLDLHCEVGEGPIWDSATSTLLFVESFGGTIYRFDPVTKQLRSVKVGQEVGVAIPRHRGGIVVSCRDGLLAVDQASGVIELLVSVETDKPGNRMNDAKCDSRGRLWTGTFSTVFERKAGAIYRIDSDLRPIHVAGEVNISNGIAWNPQESMMYFVDSSRRGIDVFDYDLKDGTVTNRRRFADIPREDGLPDGIAMDLEGCLWVALFFSGSVRRYSPEGKWIGTIHLPVTSVTSCGFGGDELRDLYITTGTHGSKKEDGQIPLNAGALFRCRPGVAGMPVHYFAG